MTKTKTGCYRVFCAEHKHLGMSAIELAKEYAKCDVDEAHALRRKWHGKLPPTAFDKFCKSMEGSNFNKLELAKMFRKTKKTRKKMKLLAKPKVNAVGANKEYQIGQLTFTT